MNYPKFLAIVAFAAIVFAPFAFAQSAPDATVVSADQVSSADATAAPTAISAQTDDSTDPETLAQELTNYQLKAADPSTGWFEKLILNAKIHELQNELNIQQALQ